MASSLPPSPHSFASSSFSPPLSRASSSRSSSPAFSSEPAPSFSPLLRPLRSSKPAPSPSRNDIFGLSWNTSAPNVSSRPRLVPELQLHHDQPCLDHLVDSPTLTSPIIDKSLKLRLFPSPPYFLGSGRHASVYAAAFSSHPSPTAPVPNKWKLCAAKRAERGEESAAIREANILTILSPGPHILRYIGLVDEATACAPTSLPSRLTLLLELCPGGTLFHQVGEHPSSITRSLWIRWAIELATAVGWCKDKRVLIGDLKPQNVLLTNKLEIRLSDFNRSTLLIHPTDSQDQPARAGTSSYAAPELVRPNGASRAGWPADVFALALTLWYALTGREPFQGVASPVERMVLVARGAFWEHECRARAEAVGEGPIIETSLRKMGSQSSRTRLGRVAIQALIGSDISSSSEEDRHPSPLPTTKTTRSSTASSSSSCSCDMRSYIEDQSPPVWFLDRQSIVDYPILELLKQMSDPDPSKRPDPLEIIRRLNLLESVPCQ